MAIRINTRAERGGELLERPALDHRQARSDRAEAVRVTAAQILAVAEHTVLIAQDVGAVLGCRGLGGRDDRRRGRRFAGRQHARTEHQDPQEGRLVERLLRLVVDGRLAAQEGDDGLDVFIAQVAAAGVRHDEERAALVVDAVADGVEDLGVRPGFQRAAGREVSGDEATDWQRDIFADIDAAGERQVVRERVTARAEHAGQVLTTGDLLGCACDRHFLQRDGARHVSLVEPDDSHGADEGQDQRHQAAQETTGPLDDNVARKPGAGRQPAEGYGCSEQQDGE